jgi:hypothetical protein
MFPKRAVIITQAIGCFYRATLRDAATSLSWLGVSDIRKVGFGLMEGIVWDELSQKRRDKFARKLRKLAARYQSFKPTRTSLVVRSKFFIVKQMHRAFAKGPKPLSLDDQYWVDNFLIKGK